MTTAPIWEPPQDTGTPPPKPPHKRRGTALIIMGSVLGGLVILIGLGLALAGTSPSGTPVAHPSASTSFYQPSVAAPAPTASPDRTYQGSCDYLLDAGGNFGSYALVGEIDLTNTGNTGVVVHTRITWPQEGSSPVTMRKTVHLPFGADKPVRFRMPATSEQIDLLQSWQDSHSYNDGCTYHAAFDSTYGPVHG